MKLFPTSARKAPVAAVGVLLALTLLPGCHKPARPPAPPKTGAATAPATTNASSPSTNLSAEFASVFDDTLPREKARDPFYPDSTRLARSVAAIGPAPPPAPVAPELKLLAISGSEKRRVATINNSILEVGEDASVRTVGRKVNVHIVEIGADYVILTIEGETGQTRLTMEKKKQ
jgi:hypothetical protein